MSSFRIPPEIEKKLEQMAVEENITKSEIVREALAEYIVKREQAARPFDLGEDLFGIAGSGSGHLSRDYKHRIKEKLHAKNNH